MGGGGGGSGGGGGGGGGALNGPAVALLKVRDTPFLCLSVSVSLFYY
jgi:hypothetical protein